MIYNTSRRTLEGEANALAESGWRGVSLTCMPSGEYTMLMVREEEKPKKRFGK